MAVDHRVKETADGAREDRLQWRRMTERALRHISTCRRIFKRPFQVIHAVPAGDVFNRARLLPDSVEAGLYSLYCAWQGEFHP